jgi:hypothetical protein
VRTLHRARCCRPASWRRRTSQAFAYKGADRGYVTVHGKIASKAAPPMSSTSTSCLFGALAKLASPDQGMGTDFALSMMLVASSGSRKRSLTRLFAAAVTALT